MVFRWSLFLGLFSSTLSFAVTAPFSPGPYVQSNPVIFIGTVVDDVPSASFEWDPGEPGWYFPTRCGTLVVERVIRCEAALGFVTGDTIQFCYPSGNMAINDSVPDLVKMASDISKFSGLVVGSRGLFPFRTHDRFGFVPGSWFLTNENQQEEVLDFIEHQGTDTADSAAETAPDVVQIRIEEDPVALYGIHFMTRGEPADSLVLRVSLGFTPGLRCCGHSYVVVEELRWPYPAPRLEFNEETKAIHVDEFKTEDWWLGAATIDGGFLNSERRKQPQPKIPGMRPGEIGGHWLSPFKSVEWLSATKFVVVGPRARFTLDRVGSLQYQLVEVERKY